MSKKKIILLIIAGGAVSIAGAITQGFSATTLDSQEMQALQGNLTTCYCKSTSLTCGYCNVSGSESYNCNWSVTLPEACDKGDSGDQCGCSSYSTACGVHVTFSDQNCNEDPTMLPDSSCDGCSETESGSTDC